MKLVPLQVLKALSPRRLILATRITLDRWETAVSMDRDRKMERWF